MIRAQDGTSSLSALGLSPTQAILRHLMAPVSVDQLETNEKECLNCIRWLVRRVEKGGSIVNQGEERRTISILLSGWAFRYQTLADGKRQILDFLFPGALIGFGSGETNWYGVEAVTDCSVASIPHTQFRRLLAICPSLAIRVAERIAESERRAHEHMTSLGRRSARERVAAFIVELASRTGADETRVLDLPVTQIMIGDALGLSNEHVCRTLRKLADDDVIVLGRHSLRVLRPQALAREAGLEPNEFTMPERLLAVAA